MRRRDAHILVGVARLLLRTERRIVQEDARVFLVSHGSMSLSRLITGIAAVVESSTSSIFYLIVLEPVMLGGETSIVQCIIGVECTLGIICEERCCIETALD